MNIKCHLILTIRTKSTNNFNNISVFVNLIISLDFQFIVYSVKSEYVTPQRSPISKLTLISKSSTSTFQISKLRNNYCLYWIFYNICLITQCRWCYNSQRTIKVNSYCKWYFLLSPRTNFSSNLNIISASLASISRKYS